MHSRSYPGTAPSAFDHGARPSALPATAAPLDPHPLSPRTQRWLALAFVLLATGASWSASAWLLTDWQLR